MSTDKKTSPIISQLPENIVIQEPEQLDPGTLAVRKQLYSDGLLKPYKNKLPTPPALEEKLEKNRFSRRALLLGGLQAGLFAGLVYNLHRLQLKEGSKYRTLAEDNRISIKPTPPVRGEIHDRENNILARNNENLRIMMHMELVKEPEETLIRLAQLIQLNDENTKLLIKNMKRRYRQSPVLIMDKLNWEQFARIRANAPDFPGITAEKGWQRHYINSAAFAHVLGVVGAASNIELAEQPVLHLPGMLVGRNGVEKGFEKTLHGKPGNVKLEVNARGQTVRRIEDTESIPGTNITLSISHKLQEQVMSLLTKQKPAAAVVMDIKTGEILALVSAPGYNPNDMLPPIPKKKWSKLRDNPERPLENRATRGIYPPGSTFKMVTALAGLEAGTISSRSRFHCNGAIYQGKHRFRCWKRSGHGRTDLIKALRESCDVFFYESSKKTGIHMIARTARKLGLGTAYDIGLADIKEGLIPDPDWKRYRYAAGWHIGETILASIGQGYVLTTPLQLAVMTARIASGKQVQPRITRYDENDRTDLSFKKLEFSQTHLDIVRQGMFEAVNRASGTGGRAALHRGDIQLAGKTGTAQVFSTGNKRIRRNSQLSKKLRDHALFVGYAPVSKPRYAVSVIVENGGSGGKVAAPLAKNILQLTLDIMNNNKKTTSAVDQGKTG